MGPAGDGKLMGREPGRHNGSAGSEVLTREKDLTTKPGEQNQKNGQARTSETKVGKPGEQGRHKEGDRRRKTE